ncbi:MAG TPA: rod shape-determining protein MreC [Acidimicrobiales bacterium]|nr:rod shape-determining protein MreC [Acidimicrobiales bacterium]
MAVYRRASRARNLLAVLVLAALTLVTIDARSHGNGVLGDVRQKVSDVFAPLQRATHAALEPVGNFFTGAAEYGSLRQENQRLRQQVAALEAQGATAADAEQRASQALAELNLPFASNIPTVLSPIIDQGSSNFDNSITIGRGTASGVAPGEPVVAAGGLVGSVLAASRDTATVRLLTDPSFAVGVSLQGGNVGSAAGTGPSQPLRVTVDTTQLPPPVEKPGSLVLTSGLQMEKFPPGIPVGRVAKSVTPPGGSEPDIEISPAVDPAGLFYVQVLLWSPA